jgi:hypothetical protein
LRVHHVLPFVSSLLRNRKTSAQNWSVSVFSLGSLLLRSETYSLIEQAKQRHRRFSFCHDIPTIQRNKTPKDPAPVSLFLPNCANWQNAVFIAGNAFFGVTGVTQVTASIHAA